jgi:hypothetical protein
MSSRVQQKGIKLQNLVQIDTQHNFSYALFEYEEAGYREADIVKVIGVN